MDSSFEAEDVFKQGAASFDAWSAVADGLERSAILLWEEAEKDLRLSRTPPWVFAPVMMLSALAIENLLKGLIVARMQALKGDGRFAHRSHDLRVLAKTAQVLITPREDDLLERLSTFLTWAGRYPIPLYHTEFASRVLDTGEAVTAAYGAPEDREIWQALFRRLRTDGPTQSREQGAV